MSETLINIDNEIKKLSDYLCDPSYDWLKEKKRLINIVSSKSSISGRHYAVDKLDKEFRGNRNIAVLDYGCGTGIYVIILLLMGYRKVNGVDVVPKFDNSIPKNLNFSEETFSLIDNKLPYDDNVFDVINSSLVLEHVHDLDNYYSEASRVLKDGGVCFFNFPHREELYDSHSRTWFIHWFPAKIRVFLWSIFARQEGEFLNGYLNLKTIYYHKKIASKYFSVIENRTADRIKNINFISYKGNRYFRMMAHRLMNMKYTGDLICSFFSIFASADIYLKK